jgi:hypothetical protein
MCPQVLAKLLQKIAKIIRLDIITGVRTPTLSLVYMSLYNNFTNVPKKKQNQCKFRNSYK